MTTHFIGTDGLVYAPGNAQDVGKREDQQDSFGFSDPNDTGLMAHGGMLAIVADGQGPSYPGIAGHEPSVEAGRKAAARIDQCMSELRAVAPNGGAYVSESNYFEKNFQQAYWGSNYPRLLEIKKKYDPSGLFIVHNGVGSAEWSADGFTKL